MKLPSASSIALSLCIAAVTVGSGYAFWLFTRQPVDTTVSTVAKPAPIIAKVKKKVIKPKQVVVYAEEAKAKLKLPTSVLNDNDQSVTGATTVKPTERSVTVTSVLDTKTGETTTYTKPEPYPWAAVESRGEARIDVGYKMDARTMQPQQVGRLSVVHDFAQVKAVHFGVAASIDTTGSTFIGVGIGYRW